MSSKNDRGDLAAGGMLTALGLTTPFLATLSPSLSAILQLISGVGGFALNTASQAKLVGRIDELETRLPEIEELRKLGEQNYESLLLAPEVFREYLCVEEPERAQEYLSLLVSLYAPGRIEFDGFREAFRVTSGLSRNEYRLLHKMPVQAKGWKEIFPAEEYREAPSEWGAAIKRLESMYLIHLEVPLYVGSVNTLVKFIDEEKAKLSEYGSKILETLHAVGRDSWAAK